MITLVTNPGTDEREFTHFSVSEGDIEEATREGRCFPTMSMAEQIQATAYHKVMDLQVVPMAKFELPWVIVVNGRISAMNHLALGVAKLGEGYKVETL